MDINYRDYDQASYILNKDLYSYGIKAAENYERAAKMYTLFCQLMGVDEICYPQGNIINYYDFFLGKSDIDATYRVDYNEYPPEHKDEQLPFENGMFMCSTWTKQRFFVCHPYRDFAGAEKQIREDRNFLDDWCDRRWDDNYCDYKILDAEYSWHNQDVTSLYIVGTLDFMGKAESSIVTYKRYVDKYFNDWLY